MTFNFALAVATSSFLFLFFFFLFILFNEVSFLMMSCCITFSFFPSCLLIFTFLKIYLKTRFRFRVDVVYRLWLCVSHVVYKEFLKISYKLRYFYSWTSKSIYLSTNILWIFYSALSLWIWRLNLRKITYCRGNYFYYKKFAEFSPHYLTIINGNTSKLCKDHLTSHWKSFSCKLGTFFKWLVLNI